MLNTYSGLFLGGAGVTLLISLGLWFGLSRWSRNRRILLRDASLSGGALEEHAKKTALGHSVSSSQSDLNWPIPRMNDNYDLILSVYKGLNEDIRKKRSVPPAAEWLLDNFYILEEQVKGLRRDMDKKAYARLPVLTSDPMKGFARIVAIAAELVSHTDGQLDETIISDYLKAYQTGGTLTDREIWAIPMVLRLSLIENIRHLCEIIRNTQAQWHKADEVIDSWLEQKDADQSHASKLFKDSLKSVDDANPSFVEHLFFRLRRSGLSYAHLLRIMDESLVKYGSTTERNTQMEHSAQSLHTVSMGNSITSLHYLATLDWSGIFESSSTIERILNQDPDGTYPRMDQQTRNYYRSRVEELASLHGVPELHIASEAITLAKKARYDMPEPESSGSAGTSPVVRTPEATGPLPAETPSGLHQPENMQEQRTWHVGYYLLGKGLKALEQRLEPKSLYRRITSDRGLHSAGLLYLGSIGLITMILVCIAIWYTLLASPARDSLLWILGGLAVLIPASEIAVTIVNWVVCKALKPTVFPRLELKDGIPEDMSTIVVVPTLLPDEERVKELLNTLEGHYLSNRDNHLYFALIGGFMDADRPDPQHDRHIVEAALSGVRELNRKYSGAGPDKFYYFQRENQFNENHNKWIGWERKRGALMEFNELLLGSRDTSFTYVSCKEPPFAKVRYIITLDSDTILPMGMARKMIGTMAHPLNRPVIDKSRGIVVEGYGLMQPRIDAEVESSNKSLFSRIFTAQEGLDPYANAISDVYQDLFGEGIYTGKGIYDLAVFHSVLKNAVPDNTILSHDLMEGSYVRTGLVTDLKLVDSHPSRYNAYAARQYRWVRGDWQLLPLLFGKIADFFLHTVNNPLSLLSRWKIFDNLRRSLVSPSLMLLAALGFCILPGSSLVWLAFFLLAMAFPFIIAVTGSLFSGRIGTRGVKRYMPVMVGVKASFLQGFLLLAFLPHQAWSMISAISVTWVRVVITKKNLLLWVTSADIEKRQKNTIGSYMGSMGASYVAALSILGLTITFRPDMVFFYLPLFLLWMSAPSLAFRISQEITAPPLNLPEEELQELGRIARKTWRYFEEFTDARSHFLAPDNHQIDPPRETAYRTSPTNIGLGLMAILSARDFGFIGTSEMTDLVVKTISNMERLDKWNGHLFNWYDTRTTKPLKPGYISTVDSGNLACYLMVLEQGLKEHLHGPIVDGRFTSGLRDTLHCAGKTGVEVFSAISAKFSLPGQAPVDLMQWSRTLLALTDDPWLDAVGSAVWKAKVSHSLRMCRKEMLEWMPAIEWIDRIPDIFRQHRSYAGILPALHEMLQLPGKTMSLSELPLIWQEAAERVRGMADELRNHAGDEALEGVTWLEHLERILMKSSEATEQAKAKVEVLITRVRALADAMKFAPLYDAKKQLFSIGLTPEDNKLTNSYYDLLASEARQTSYLAIARGEIPAAHWTRMGRVLTVVEGYKGLISWTGTMFEYLMPLLIMKRYDNTLLDETYSFVIRSQKKYGRQRNMPWGTSESGFNSIDASLDYQYKAIGVPWLGLKRGLIEDAVAAPYATFLALMVDPAGAVRNIELLKREGLDGPYGLYEAADYTPERLPHDAKRAVVKSFMAHHQGMSLMALDNFLHDNIMQERFHADPAIHAARLLLQEKIPTNLLFTKETKEKVIPFKEAVSKETSPVRHFTQIDPVLPKSHILSNGNYSILLTDRGTGYSKNKMMAITRWRSDSTLDPYGMFFYLRNTGTGKVWSATQAPLPEIPEKYEVTFTADKATYRRVDGQIATETEVVVASGDNAEIRRLTLKNQGTETCTIEVTSCFEAVMAPQAADVAHPAFSNLFVETSYLPERHCLVANRRPRADTDKNTWLAHAVVLNGNAAADIQFETDRAQWLGRGHNMASPLMMERVKPMTGSVGAVLDPVMSLRATLKIEPGKSASVSFLTATGGSNEQLLALIDKLAGPDAVESAFRLALTRSQVENRYLNLSATELGLYQDMISDILFLSPLRRAYHETIQQNVKGQSSLWQYSISGDRPIVLLVLQKTQKVEILYEVLQAHEYWRLMDLKADLVILDEEAHSYNLPLHNLISDIVLSRQTHDILKQPGDVFILDKTRMPEEDVRLLYAVARIILQGDGRSMGEQIKDRPSVTWPEILPRNRHPAFYPPSAMKELDLQKYNGLGGFRADGHEYIIQLGKDQHTPAPWVNVVANPHFGFLVSEAGSGYTWSQNSRENKLTPWSNDAVSDTPGEVLYIRDTDTGELWTSTALPIREDEPYLIKHGFGYSVFEHTSHGIEQWLTQHVPLDASVKVSILGLRNLSPLKRHLTLTYYMQPILGVSDQTTSLHVRSRLGRSGNLLMENPWQEEFADSICFLDTSANTRTLTGDRKEFFGSGGIRNPESLHREGLSGAVGTGYDPCGAIQVKVTLEPNDRREIVFLLGTGESSEKAENLAGQYRTVEKARESLAAVKAFWKEKMNVVRVKTPGLAMNLMIDGWLPYQVISCRLWARSGFYQAGGAFGFRDQLQDSLAIAPIWPEVTRAQILLHAAHQFEAGDVQHWWHEPLGKGTRTRISDDLLWLPYVTAEYIRITGDEGILQEQVPFLDEPILAEFEEERYGKPVVSIVTATLFEHLTRAVDHTLRFGPHGLPLMGTGDWNDGMNAVGNKGLGESVWLGWFQITILDMLRPICIQQGDPVRADAYGDMRRRIVETIEREAWDGGWYRRAWFDNGQMLGSAENSECKIDSIAQTWAVISGAGEPQRSVQAMRSVEDWLVTREEGLIKLLHPPFGDGDLEPGYIKGYLPGVRENGGQYTHAAAWAIIAFALMGDGDKAWELFELINPINHTGNHRDCARYKVEPYVMAADVYSVKPHGGRGGWSWYTGSAGWMYRAGLEYLLGFRKTGDFLVMDPCIPRKWTEYTIQYKFLGTVYDIRVKNPDGVNKGVREILVDGKTVEGNRIPLINDRGRHEVEVSMG